MFENHRFLTIPLLALLMAAFFVPRCLAQGASRPTPEEIGFSSEKLQELDSVIQGHVDKGKLAGVAVLIGRGGSVARLRTYGYQDIEKKIATREASMFRLASITKIVVSAAALICYEDGLFLLDDPVKEYIPELAELRVLASEPGEGATGAPKTEPLTRDVTVRDLLRHTAGFLYVDDYPMKGTGMDTGFGSWDRSLKEFVAAITEYPLAYQPGSKWRYSYSYDIVGHLLEVITRQPADGRELRGAGRHPHPHAAFGRADGHDPGVRDPGSVIPVRHVWIRPGGRRIAPAQPRTDEDHPLVRGALQHTLPGERREADLLDLLDADGAVGASGNHGHLHSAGRAVVRRAIVRPKSGLIRAGVRDPR